MATDFAASAQCAGRTLAHCRVLGSGLSASPSPGMTTGE